jgi:hypothetical protein
MNESRCGKGFLSHSYPAHDTVRENASAAHSCAVGGPVTGHAGHGIRRGCALLLVLGFSVFAMFRGRLLAESLQVGVDLVVPDLNLARIG